MTWLHLPNSLSSQAQAADYSQPSTFSDGERSAMSSGISTPLMFSKQGSETDTLTTPQSGMTLLLSTGDRGLDLWMLSLRASRVNHSAQPEKDLQKTIPVMDGLPSSEFFARYNLDTRSWRTSQVSYLNPISDECLGNWPKRVSILNMIASRRKRSARTINGKGSGLLPTPLAGRSTWQSNHGKRSWTLRGMALRNQFPTPTAQDAKNSTFPKSQSERDSLIGSIMREKFPTPTTPRPHDSENTAGKFMPGQNQKDLTWYVNHYPTPTANGWGSEGHRNKLSRMDISDEEQRKMTSGHGGQLNPNWVEWLMGWPIGWTDLEPLAMDKFQTWLQLHGRGS